MDFDGRDLVAKTFEFRKRSERLDWNLLAKTDVNFIVHTIDLKLLQENIRNVVCCCLEKEFDSCDLNPNVSKLFRLAQLIIEYLLFSQEVLKSRITRVENDLKKERDEKDLLQRELSAKTGVIKSMKYEVNRAKKVARTSHFECDECGKMFLSSEFLQSHMLRKHRHDDYLISRRKQDDGPEDSNEKPDPDIVKKEVNELQNRLLSTQNELQMEKEAARELTEQVKTLQERISNFEDLMLSQKELTKSQDPETEHESKPAPAALDTVKAAVQEELETQRVLIDDLKFQLMSKEEENNRVLQSLLQEQNSRFEEQILFLKKSIQEDLIAKTIVNAANQAAVEDVRKDFEIQVQVSPSPQNKSDSQGSSTKQGIFPDADQPETPPIPRPRTRKRSLEGTKSKAPPQTEHSSDSLTTYESQDEESKHDVMEDYKDKLKAFKVDKNALDQVRYRAIRRSREDLNKQYPNFTRKREALAQRINTQASNILKNHFRSRSRSETVLDSQRAYTSTQDVTKPIFQKKTLVESVVQSLKAAGRFLRGPRPKRKPWSSTLSLPAAAGSTMDLVVPAPKKPIIARTGSSARSRRRVAENLYDESPLKASPRQPGNEKRVTERAWSDSDLSSYDNGMTGDASIRREEDHKNESQSLSKFKSLKEVKSKPARRTESIRSIDELHDEKENKAPDQQENNRSPDGTRESMRIKQIFSESYESRNSDISQPMESARRQGVKARRSIVFKESRSSLSDEKSYEALSPVITTEQYAQEKVAIQSRIEELTKSIEEQLNSRPNYTPAGGVSILRRKEQPRATMYDNASDS